MMPRNNTHPSFPVLRRKGTITRVDAPPRRLPTLREPTLPSLSCPNTPLLSSIHNPSTSPSSVASSSSTVPGALEPATDHFFREPAALQLPPSMRASFETPDPIVSDSSLLIIPAATTTEGSELESPQSPTVFFTPATPQLIAQKPKAPQTEAPSGRARGRSVMTRSSPAPAGAMCDGDVAALRAAQTEDRLRHRKPRQTIDPHYLFPEWALRAEAKPDVPSSASAETPLHHRYSLTSIW
eukprot:TRINITY_DN8042_c0_g1_i1.p1 TRINITY_DN8042_c0_g1~~TRINITY_DN8042_c0_g1_i1.p1  ORF type:complete len:240 (-),score=16.29 TRINITY_DN8042_c0_g1_i1:194-913(-)